MQGVCVKNHTKRRSRFGGCCGREGSTLSLCDKVGRVSLGGLNDRRFAKRKRETSQPRPLRLKTKNTTQWVVFLFLNYNAIFDTSCRRVAKVAFLILGCISMQPFLLMQPKLIFKSNRCYLFLFFPCRIRTIPPIKSATRSTTPIGSIDFVTKKLSDPNDNITIKRTIPQIVFTRFLLSQAAGFVCKYNFRFSGPIPLIISGSSEINSSYHLVELFSILNTDPSLQ